MVDEDVEHIARTQRAGTSEPRQLSIRRSWIYSQSTAFDFWQWMQRMRGEQLLWHKTRNRDQ
ncbi:MAG: hypothetical protein AUG08_14225 [Acidobacteria bacterium 13_1_20CM_2_55_15]|nr:MAG: hypothetical protein AUH28_20630 [Acidobacteria bacterium 13_1_40CM_56_16]OLD70587.1 MAG: hypothetical protein AUI45_04170 [Acidobacteria bacterium 13_1_40CM_2_56_11]OLE86628.1 MAG: hypothetical protein AUG08_14225 [Acidobacteria bacterium 13_1_20CM_2_55_15]PYR86275.1 MAG: hypothetical protein DMG19_13340 [Acidobacteriota bacterium]